MKVCPKCGWKFDDSETTCTNCGSKLYDKNTRKYALGTRERPVWGILALVLGFLGGLGGLAFGIIGLFVYRTPESKKYMYFSIAGIVLAFVWFFLVQILI